MRLALFSLVAAWAGIASQAQELSPEETRRLADASFGKIASCIYSYSLGNAEVTAAERADLTEILLADYDANRNGQLELSELLLARCHYATRFKFDENHSGYWEANEQQKINAGLLAHYDANQDGRLSEQELQTAVVFEELLNGSMAVDLFDKNQNRRLDPDEREQLFSSLRKTGDLNHNGIIEFNELAYYGEEEDALVLLWSMYADDLGKQDLRLNETRKATLKAFLAKEIDFNHDGKLDHEEIVLAGQFLRFLNKPSSVDLATFRQRLAAGGLDDFKAIVFPRYDVNRDGHLDIGEFQLALQQKSRIDNGLITYPEYDRNQDGWLNAAEYQALQAKLLEQCDANHNGCLEPEEIYFAGEARVLARFAKDANGFSYFLLTAFDNNHDRLMSPQEIATLKAAWLAIYDLDHNHQLDPLELYLAVVCESHYADRIFMAPEWHGDILMFQPDIGKKQGQLPQLVSLYDGNHDGRLDRDELRFMNWQEYVWDKLAADNQDFDLDKDNWLNPKERQALTAACLPEYDQNHDGRLDHGEWTRKLQADHLVKAILRLNPEPPPEDGLSRPPTTRQKPEIVAKATKLYDQNGDGRLDFDEVNLASTLGWLARLRLPLTDAERQRLTADPSTAKEMVDKYMLPFCDRNHDGKLDIDELDCGRSLINVIPRLLGGKLKNREFDIDGNGKIDAQEWQAFLDSTAKTWDLDGNGQADLDELYERISFEFSLCQIAIRFPNADKNRDGGLDAAEKSELLAELAKHDDLDGNGKIDAAEINLADNIGGLAGELSWLYPDFKVADRTHLMEPEIQALEKRLLQNPDNDLNHNGRIDAREIRTLWQRQTQEIEKARNQIALAAQRLEQDKAWLPKYDFNGNGKLDLEERQRAETDAKSGIQAPAQEE